MQRILGFLSASLVAVALVVPVSSAQALSLGVKAAQQAAMQQHVDRQTVDGAYLHFDTKTVQVRTLYPVTAHPVIMQMGEQFVLCFDFAADAGKTIEVDFYVARKGESFIVFHTAVAGRGILMNLIDAGKVTPTD